MGAMVRAKWSLRQVEDREPARGRARVLLADDHVLVAEAFKTLLEPDFEVVGTGADGRELLRVAAGLRPDVVLVDLNMPLLNGLDAGEQLKQLLPKLKIIVLTMDGNAEVAATALEKWASGYLLKTAPSGELQKAMNAVLRGEKYVAPSLRKALQELPWSNGRAKTKRTPTPRQREVLQLLAEGHTMKEAAGILHVTARTVAFHKYRIMQEFGIANNAELLRLAIKLKLVNQG